MEESEVTTTVPESEVEGPFEGPLSPYKFALEVGKRPQMVYNYIGQGFIKVETTETGKMYLTPGEMNKWHAKWTAKKTS